MGNYKLISNGFTSFCNLFTENVRQRYVNIVKPYACSLSPMFYPFSLFLSALEHSFEIRDSWSERICFNFCSRE